MTTIDEAIQYVNQIYGQVGGVSVPKISSGTTVGGYLAWVESVQVQALKTIDDAIVAAQQAAQYMDVSLTLQLLSNNRAQLIDLYAEVFAALGGVSTDMTLEQAWDQITEPTPTPEPTPEPVPVWPDDTAVVLYGDTPDLLRAQDEPVLTGTEFGPIDSSLTLTSPEISIEPTGEWHIGAVNGTGVGAAYELINNATTSAAKGLLGEVFNSTEATMGSYGVKAWEAYELGQLITSKVEGSIGLISSGLEVLQGTRSLSDWNDEYDTFTTQAHNDFKTLATSALVSTIPVVGWVLAPVSESYLKLSYQLKNTNSFEVSVSSANTLSGGVAGGIFLAGGQDDLIFLGDGNALAAGGSGNDIFRPGTGEQILVGATGVDTVVVSDLSNSMQLSAQTGGYSLSNAASHWSLTEVERIPFVDRDIALDFATVAKVLGAAFGAGAVSNQEYVGIGLHFLDDLNYSYDDLMNLAINVRLGTNATNAQVVDLLYTNVVGTAPDAATRKSFTDLLDNGSFTVSSLGVLAADTDLNKANINLVGLTQTGLEYFPFAG